MRRAAQLIEGDLAGEGHDRPSPDPDVAERATIHAFEAHGPPPAGGCGPRPDQSPGHPAKPGERAGGVQEMRSDHDVLHAAQAARARPASGVLGPEGRGSAAPPLGSAPSAGSFPSEGGARHSGITTVR